MELIISALHAIRTGVGDVFVRIIPSHLITLVLHVGEEVLACDGVFQCLVDCLHQTELPALAALGGSVLAWSQALFSFLPGVRLQHREAVHHADLVVYLTLFFDRGWRQVQLFAVLEAYRIDDNMRVDVVGVGMGSHHALLIREQLFGKLAGNLIGLPRRDLLLI